MISFLVSSMGSMCSARPPRLWTVLILSALLLVLCGTLLKLDPSWRGSEKVNSLNEGLSGDEALYKSVLFQEQLFQFRRDPFVAFWVNGDGKLLPDRIPLYNSAISQVRLTIWKERGNQDWRDNDTAVVVLWESRDDFLQKLGEFTHVRTVALEWWEDGENPREHWTSQKDFANVVVQNYYTYVATEPFCTWIRTPGFTKARYDAVLNRKCTSDISAAVKATSLEPVFFHGKSLNTKYYWPNKGLSYPSYFYTTLPRHVFYLHVLEDAIITQGGDVFSGNLKLVPYGCRQDRTPTKPLDYKAKPVHDEVFIISQNLGAAYFHKNLEDIPRLAPYMEFLLRHKEVLVHVMELRGRTAAVLKALGLAPERLISGVIRGKIVYMPQGTACGFPQIQEMQVLAKLFADVIKKGATSDSQPRAMASLTGNTPDTEELTRKNMVVIHRSGRRRLSDANATELALKSLADEYNLNYVLFHDKQLPSFEDTMRLFHQAALVFAPHGAGLANVMYCQPGTYVIEAVCNTPHVNLCFLWSAHVLGMRYHAIPSRKGCEEYISVDSAVIARVAKGYLEQIKRNSLNI